MKFEIESESIVGTNADSWTDFAEQLNAWLAAPALDLEAFEEQGRAFAARAVMLAGGEKRRPRA